VTRSARVLYLIPSTNLGGEELSTLSLAKGLQPLGFQIGLGTSGGSLLDEFESLGVAVHLLPVDGRRPYGLVRGAQALRSLLARHEYDIIHAQEVFPAVMGQIARRVLGCRFKLVYHYRGVRPRWMPYVGRAMPRWVDHIITNSEATRRTFLRYGATADSVTTIYNGLDWTPFDQSVDRASVRAEWSVPVDAPVAGTVGRLHPVKGHRVFLDAARAVLDQVPDAYFVLVGDGPMRAELESQARALGIDSRVRFLGSRRDVPRLLAAMDLLALPSTEEAIGRVLVEAHAAGLPAVASRIGGTPEVVEHGRSGFLVPPGDPPALAVRMRELLSDRDRSRQMGAVGKEHVRSRFGEPEMIEKTRRVYATLLME
jgi:glycosyltransferase involved in cell wall biosynthesis